MQGGSSRHELPCRVDRPAPVSSPGKSASVTPPHGPGAASAPRQLARIRWQRNRPPLFARAYSHSMVAGGLLVMSYTTRFTPGTSLTIRLLTRPSTSSGSLAQSAVMPS